MTFGPIALLVTAVPAAAATTGVAGAWLAASPWALGYARRAPRRVAGRPRSRPGPHGDRSRRAARTSRDRSTGASAVLTRRARLAVACALTGGEERGENRGRHEHGAADRQREAQVAPTARDAEGVLERAEDGVVARHG